MFNHEHDIVAKIEIKEYGERKGHYGRRTMAGSATYDYLHISSNPKPSHSAYRIIKLVAMMPFCTKKEIIWATHGSGQESCHRYWSDLHRRGFIEQFRTEDNLIVYAVTSLGCKYLAEAEK